MNKIVLITGVSSGLGEAIAQEFKSKGNTIIGVSRTKPKIELDQWYEADITAKGAAEKIFSKVEKDFGKLDILINNAGRGNYATWEEFSEEELRDLFELNFFAMVKLTHAFLAMLKESKGTVINICSVAGKSFVPCMGPYCATKFAVAAFSDSLRSEIKHYGVNVINALPGRIHTGFSSRALGPRSTPPTTPKVGSNPQGFAKKVYKAYRRQWRSFTYPALYGFFMWFTRTFPRIYEWVACKAWKIGE